MAFKEATSRFIELPINGKLYKIVSPDAKTGLWAQKLFTLQLTEGLTDEEAEKLRMDDDEERDLYDRLLGSVKDQMIDDGVDWETLSTVGQTVLIWVATDEDSAEAFWNQEMSGPKGVKQPEDHKPAKKSSAAKSARPASRGGSTRRSSPAKKAASNGRPSSNTGS